MATIDSVLRDAYAVLLPAYADIVFDEKSRSFFQSGGVAALLGSTRNEYVDRRMSAERIASETPEGFRSYAAQAERLAGPVLIAVDHEIGGVHRLHGLAPLLRHPSAALKMSSEEIETFGRESAAAAAKLGVNLFLAPVLDAVSGPNPWLANRSLSSDPEVVATVTSAFISGVQSGGVAATAKHFPGFRITVEDPFHSETVTVPGSIAELAPGFAPYRAAINVGVKAIMTGPVPVDAIDPDQPASTSRKVVDLLRIELGFTGLIISDDLDLPGTLRGRTVPDVAVESLRAGVELLLLASGPQVDIVADHIARAVETGEIPRETLAIAAEKVRRLAGDLSRSSRLDRAAPVPTA
jgi:beta-N-acetylhexosaminidase